MQKQMVKRKKNQRGNILVEAALIFVLAMGLLIGMYDLVQIMFVHQTVVERTRAAARWAAVNTYNSDQIKNMVLYNSTTAPSGGGSGLFGMTTSNITVAHDTSDGVYADRVQITVSGYSYSFFAAAIVNSIYPASGQGSVSASRTGLTVNMTIPHETVN